MVECLTCGMVEAAKRLGCSRRWLQDWLAHHPVDYRGKPFYSPVGHKKRFTDEDLNRILDALKDQKLERMGRSAELFRRAMPLPRSMMDDAIKRVAETHADRANRKSRGV